MLRSGRWGRVALLFALVSGGVWRCYSSGRWGRVALLFLWEPDSARPPALLSTVSGQPSAGAASGADELPSPSLPYRPLK